MPERIGVFLCRCGDNIGGLVDFTALEARLKKIPGVAFVAEHELLCSPDGKQFFSEQMKAQEGTHAVVAACSPKDHEKDFQDELERIGLNRYLLQLANIREHCTWVTRDKQRAFDKSLAMIQAAIRRVKLHEALREQEIECNADVLVIGGGVAGIEAALLLAQENRKVTVVESTPSLGGRVPLYDEIAPNMECAPCLMAPRLSAIAEAKNIRILTNAAVTKIVGFLGNFEATVERQARYVNEDQCIGCDECMQACPVSVTNSVDEGLGKRKAVYIPFPGAVPNCAVVDRSACLRFHDKSCDLCVPACPLEAMAFDQTDETLTLRVGGIVLATGFSTFDPSPLGHLGYGAMPDVYTLAEFERLASTTGPTGGKIVKRSGQPAKRIAVVHCVGRKELGYCSGICCEAASKVSILSHKQDSPPEVIHLLTDFVSRGFLGASLRTKAESTGATFVQVESIEAIQVRGNAEGMVVHYADLSKHDASTHADMVVLVTGACPNEATTRFADMLALNRDDAGFPAADHPLLRPAQSCLDGIYVVGGAAGPKNVSESVMNAQAAVGMALARLQPGRMLKLETITAYAQDSQCSGCLVCMAVCPYKAPTRTPDGKRVEVNQALCKGCGTCVATCPGGAAKARHFSDDQLSAELKEVLHG